MIKNLRDFETASKRRQALEKELNVTLGNVGDFSFTEEETKNKNIENLIGAVQVPLGIAGPLKINGQYAKGDFFLPLATSEGALVASVCRGSKALNLNGGAQVLVENVGASRAPVFKTSGIIESQKFIKFIEENFSLIKKIAESTSSHLKLLKISSWMEGQNVWLRFLYDTNEAMGLNMITIATDKVIKELIEPKTKIKCLALSGNMCVDKKPNWLNFILGRGKRVWAESLIKEKTVKEVLKTSVDEIVETSKSKILYGSAMAGSLGFNQHFSNMIAAIFCATGQDLAHIAESSMGITTVEKNGKDLYISVYLPDLMIGTIGGGTGLPTQKEALSILNIPDSKLAEGEQVLKLTEVIGAVVLAGELSLASCLAQGSLACAHQKLGRGKHA